MIFLRSPIALGLVLVLLLAACSGSDGDQAVSSGDGPSPTTEASELPGTADEGLATDGSEGSAGGDAGTDQPEINTEPPAVVVPDVPITGEMVAFVAEQFLRGPVPAESTQCLVETSEADPQSSELVRGAQLAEYVPGPDTLRSFAVQLYSCIDPQVLATAFGGFGGTTPEEQASFTNCVAPLLDGESGRDVYLGLNDFGLGLESPPAQLEATVSTMNTCISPESVAERFASQAELVSGFTIDVDRQCVIDAWTQTGVIDDIWDALIARDEATLLALDESVGSCGTPYESGLAQEVPADFTAWSGTGALAGVETTLRNAIYTEAPPTVIDTAKTYEAVITTADGEMRFTLFDNESPITVNSFVALARDGFYDRTVFHRVLENFMAQAGDPTASGSGGPGYSFEDETDNGLPLDRRGLLAMANAGPDTNGSQFFIIFEPVERLNGLHTVFGELTAGDDVLAAIDLRNPDNPTSRGEEILSIEIIET